MPWYLPWQLTFLATDNHVVLWPGKPTGPFLAPSGPHVLLSQSGLRLSQSGLGVLSLCSHLPCPLSQQISAPPGLPPFYSISLGPSISSGPEKAPEELVEGINADREPGTHIFSLRPCNGSVREGSRLAANQRSQSLHTTGLSTGLWRKGRPADLGEVRTRAGTTSFDSPSAGLPASLAQPRPGFRACLPLAF